MALIRQFVIDSRIALDAITAAQRGVRAIVGGDTYCTYLPSESEGLGNLTKAIGNIKQIQDSTIRTNKNAMEMRGFLDSNILDATSTFFSRNPTF